MKVKLMIVKENESKDPEWLYFNVGTMLQITIFYTLQICIYHRLAK